MSDCPNVRARKMTLFTKMRARLYACRACFQFPGTQLNRTSARKIRLVQQNSLTHNEPLLAGCSCANQACNFISIAYTILALALSFSFKSPPSMKQVPIVCPGHTRPVVDLAFSKVNPVTNEYFLIAACKDGKPILRHGDTGDWIGTFEGHKGAVWGVSLNDEGTLAASGSADFEAKIWDTSDGTNIHSFTCKHIVRSVNFGFASDKLLVAGNEMTSKLFDLNQYNLPPKEFTGHSGSIRHALLYDNDRRFITTSEDKTVRFWDIDSGQEIKTVTFEDKPVSLELSINKTVATICYGTKVSFWNMSTMERIKEFEMSSTILSASIHPDNHVFICGGEDFKMYKCDFYTGVELESFKGHFGPVHTVRFSPDGELYASGSEDGTLRLWQTTVGRTYGLWTVVAPSEHQTNSNNKFVADLRN